MDNDVWIDVHTHLDHYSGRNFLKEIKNERILSFGNSMDLDSYRANKELAAACPLIVPAFGIHPWNAPRYAKKTSSLDKCLREAVILGEIGLDYHFVKDARQHRDQRRLLDHFFRDAAAQSKLIILHTKGAEKDVLDMVKAYRLTKVIVHWYSGPKRVLDLLLDLGAYFSFGVALDHSARIRDLALRAPLDRILSETDNPGALEWLTGQKGDPSEIKNVVRTLARIKRIQIDAARSIIKENVLRLIGDDPRLAPLFRMTVSHGRSTSQPVA